MVACGGGNGGNGGGNGGNGGGKSGNGGGANEQSSNATLSSLSVSGARLDQIFQSSQKTYTCSVGFLATSVTLIAKPSDAAASIRVNGSPVDSGSESSLIPLNEGDNTIEVMVTAEDGKSADTYTVIVTRATAEDFGEQAYLNADSDEEFGYSVALSGNTLVVGDPNRDIRGDPSKAGAVYVFVRDGPTWSQQAHLRASNAYAQDQFGLSVALSGETLVVGATGERRTVSSSRTSGAVYVFVRDGATWRQQAYLKVSNADSGDEFGYSVALSGETLVVGAPEEGRTTTADEADNSVLSSGAVYVFVRDGTSWSQQAYLKASNSDSNDQFGHSVAISGETLVVGATRVKNDVEWRWGVAPAPTGAAYVFARNGTSWSQQAYLKASNADSGDEFGYSVTLSNDTLVVGAPRRGVRPGAAHVFTRNGISWSQEAYLQGDAGYGDHFGGAVALSGETLVVGAKTSSIDNSPYESGAAYVFARNGTSWSQQAYLKASDAGYGDHFGGAVALSGETLVVGAAKDYEKGAVYIWQ
ncbi:cadherin-like beta sandwich domain-containing protein [Marinobacter sp. chi1]|uniref:Cadherin-like beta sandwich domain-containing protein n=1 Tax=Marinobacter suaedae TaxID=3057675 RepID=A0ABT8VW38_9GAMM|nr:cadherin-like beta sandwich domain-containing protein [Marinobacter sp. chi1]MDO3720193.1 cadherin-like beta sandwich domain-containing protein [Marinobacter sp. chi1]